MTLLGEMQISGLEVRAFRQFRSLESGIRVWKFDSKVYPLKSYHPKMEWIIFCFLHVCDWHVLSRFLLTHVLQEVCTLVLFFCVVNLVDLFVFGQIPPAGCDEFLYRGCGFGKKGS